MQENKLKQQPKTDIQRQMEDLRLQREIVGVLVTQFVWAKNQNYPDRILNYSKDMRSIYLKEDDYYFRSFFADTALNEGIHYWEIIADSQTEHELKIGISKSLECD